MDQWAKRVRTETERHLYRFRAKPAEFENSEGYFRMLMMAVVFYEDFNVHYNPERVSSPQNINPNDRFFADSQDIFLHGLIGSRRMGTCSSLPVLYAAVGRRLGYPLKLVTTKAHLFLRWEDGKERFNLEATGRGMNRYDDDHFKKWPFTVSEEEIRAEGYLKSLTAAEELAVFLSLRGNCLKEGGRMEEAATCYAQAARLAPGSRSYGLLLADVRPRELQSPIPGAVGVGVPTADPNPMRKLKPK
ncbi:MAG: transglutaminase family protein [Verrucomicrobiota bacterium]